MPKVAAQAGAGAGAGNLKPKRVVRSKADREADAAAKKAARDAKVAERARATEVKAKQKELKRQEKEREKLEKDLFSFKRMLDMIGFIEHHLPKGGPTKQKWELVAKDMNTSASVELYGRYNAGNVYQKHLTWSKKVDPTGNPQLGDEEELDLMRRYKAAEQKMLAAAQPVEALAEEEEEAELKSKDHTCAHCGKKDLAQNGALFRYIPAGTAPVRREEGVDKFKKDAFLRVATFCSSNPATIAEENKYMEAKAQRKVRIYCLGCMEAATAQEGAGIPPGPVPVDAGKRGVRDCYSKCLLASRTCAAIFPLHSLALHTFSSLPPTQPMDGKAKTRTDLSTAAASKKSAEELAKVVETLRPALKAREEEMQKRTKMCVTLPTVAQPAPCPCTLTPFFRRVTFFPE
jgi:hypothetical protein